MTEPEVTFTMIEDDRDCEGWTYAYHEADLYDIKVPSTTTEPPKYVIETEVTNIVDVKTTEYDAEDDTDLSLFLKLFTFALMSLLFSAPFLAYLELNEFSTPMPTAVHTFTFMMQPVNHPKSAIPHETPCILPPVIEVNISEALLDDDEDKLAVSGVFPKFRSAMRSQRVLRIREAVLCI
jgi:hypothetical protein